MNNQRAPTYQIQQIAEYLRLVDIVEEAYAKFQSRMTEENHAAFSAASKAACAAWENVELEEKTK